MTKCNLKQICRDKNMTIQKLADIVDMPAQQIHKYDSEVMATAVPTVINAIKMAKALGVTVEQIWQLE